MHRTAFQTKISSLANENLIGGLYFPYRLHHLALTAMMALITEGGNTDGCDL